MVEMESRNSFQLFKLQPKRDHIYSCDILKNIQNLYLPYKMAVCGRFLKKQPFVVQDHVYTF